MKTETFAQAMAREGVRQLTMMDDKGKRFSAVCIGYPSRGFGATPQEAIDQCKRHPKLEKVA